MPPHVIGGEPEGQSGRGILIQGAPRGKGFSRDLSPMVREILNGMCPPPTGFSGICEGAEEPGGDVSSPRLPLGFLPRIVPVCSAPCRVSPKPKCLHAGVALLCPRPACGPGAAFRRRARHGGPFGEGAGKAKGNLLISITGPESNQLLFVETEAAQRALFLEVALPGANP